MIPSRVLHDRYCPDLALTLCRAALDAYAGPDRTKQLRDQWQAEESTLIVAGDTEALLLVWHDCAILAFRGTSSTADIWIDLAATRSKWRGTHVHSGFLSAWKSIRPAIVAALQSKLLDGQPLYVTGHSLGGAIATVCAADFGSGRYAGRTHLYTFGSPRVGSVRFARLCNERLRDRQWRLVHSNDAISRVPRLFRASFLLPAWIPLLPTPFPLWHTNNLVFLTEDKHPLVKPHRRRVALERLIGFRLDAGRDHLLKNYLEALSI